MRRGNGTCAHSEMCARLTTHRQLIRYRHVLLPSPVSPSFKPLLFPRCNAANKEVTRLTRARPTYPNRTAAGGRTFDGFSFGEVRMMDLSRVRGALWLAPLALTFAACDGTAPKASHPLSLSITTKGTSGASLPSGMGAAIQVGSGANSLTINQA